MADTSTAEAPESEHTDKSPEATDRAKVEAQSDGGPKPGQRAEVSNLDIVRHYFDGACEHMGLREDLRTVFWSPYREVTVQIPVKLADGKTGSSTTAPAGPTRAVSGSTPRSTSTRSGPSPR